MEPAGLSLPAEATAIVAWHQHVPTSSGRAGVCPISEPAEIRGTMCMWIVYVDRKAKILPAIGLTVTAMKLDTAKSWE